MNLLEISASQLHFTKKYSEAHMALADVVMTLSNLKYHESDNENVRGYYNDLFFSTMELMAELREVQDRMVYVDENFRAQKREENG